MVAELSPEVRIAPARLGAAFPATVVGARALLDELDCLQCRGVLLHWLAARNPGGSGRSQGSGDHGPGRIVR